MSERKVTFLNGVKERRLKEVPKHNILKALLTDHSEKRKKNEII